MKAKSGERTLLASVLLSSPGPIILGAALFAGRSATQLADFVRRTAELVAMVVSLVIYRSVHGGELDVVRQERLERAAALAVGAAMCLSGAVMVVLALFSSSQVQGNVVPGLIIAILGVCTNSWFWLRYRKLSRVTQDVILSAQSRLYAAKSLVDACVTIALAFVVIAPNTPAASLIDSAGSAVVAVYLVAAGVSTIRDKQMGGVS
ncbi:MAG: cation transporter [Firmicutes bacterium]|nr:cation transporter [Bacillota bacterium]